MNKFSQLAIAALIMTGGIISTSAASEQRSYTRMTDKTYHQKAVSTKTHDHRDKHFQKTRAKHHDKHHDRRRHHQHHHRDRFYDQQRHQARQDHHHARRDHHRSAVGWEVNHQRPRIMIQLPWMLFVN